MQFCIVQRIVKIQHSLRTKKITKHIDAFTLLCLTDVVSNMHSTYLG